MINPVESEITWPSGGCWTIGILSRTPAQLDGSEIPLAFIQGADDLDHYLAARVFDEQISWFLLFRHVGSPSAGTEVKVDIGVKRGEGLLAVSRCLRLDIRDFEWVTPYESFDAALSDRPSLLSNPLEAAPLRQRDADDASRRLRNIPAVRKPARAIALSHDPRTRARLQKARYIAFESLRRGDSLAVTSILHFEYGFRAPHYRLLFGGDYYEPIPQHLKLASNASWKSAQRIVSLTSASHKGRRRLRIVRGPQRAART